MTSLRLLLPALLLLGAAARPAAAKEWFDLDPRATVLRWEGFSLRGSHEGTLRASQGFLRYGPGMRLVGGEVVVPLASLVVTDIPETDPVPRRRLRDHLLAEDFFWAARFPTARLVVTGATGRGVGRKQVSARLTMRGVTLPITFAATERVLPTGQIEVRARLELDRQRWGVRFRRDRDLFVRDVFTLDVLLVATPRAAPPRA
jgi:polyisoprenoid-binding protein YceI